MKIGENIKFYRQRVKLTQQDLAEKLDTSQTHIGNIERGARFPSFPMFFQIAEVLGCTAADLLREDDEPVDVAKNAFRKDSVMGTNENVVGGTTTGNIIFKRKEGPKETEIILPPIDKSFAFIEEQMRLGYIESSNVSNHQKNEALASG